MERNEIPGVRSSGRRNRQSVGAPTAGAPTAETRASFSTPERSSRMVIDVYGPIVTGVLGGD
jgi:hypothetical protein